MSDKPPPEIVEVRIMSDFINQNCKDVKFKKIYNVEKGNIPYEYLDGDFTLSSNSNGKELKIFVNVNSEIIPIYIFMGMNGNWKYVDTENWNETKHTRLRFDSVDGKSLILHGGYMGPKYKIRDPFIGTKRGPDLIDSFDSFKSNVLDNTWKKDFDKSIPNVMLDQKYFNGIGAYMCAEIIGRLDLNPNLKFNTLNNKEISDILDMCKLCCKQSLENGGGELISWKNPLNSKNTIKEWLQFYNNKKDCSKYKFGKRNIWIKNKYILT